MDHYSAKKDKTVSLPKLVEYFVNLNQGVTNSLVTKYLQDKNVSYEELTSKYEILLNYGQEEMTDSLDRVEDPSDYKIQPVEPNVLRYLEGHCWLLACLVQSITEDDSISLKLEGEDSSRIRCLRNMLTSPWTETTKVLFGGNQTLASIQENISTRDLWLFLEKTLKENPVHDCLQLVRAIPDRLLLSNVELQLFKDKILASLITRENLDDEEVLQLVYQIRDITVLAQTILSSLQKWPVNVCRETLMHALHHKDKDKLPDHCRLHMNETLCRVNIFQKMLPHFTKEMRDKNMTWYDVVYCTPKTDPVHIVQSLIEGQKFELCLEWIEHQVFSSKIQSLVTQDLLIGLLKNEEGDFENASKVR